MIIKSFEINKINLDLNKFFLFCLGVDNKRSSILLSLVLFLFLLIENSIKCVSFNILSMIIKFFGFTKCASGILISLLVISYFNLGRLNLAKSKDMFSIVKGIVILLLYNSVTLLFICIDL